MSNDLLTENKIGFRYAKALFSLALKNDGLDWVIYNINALAHLFETQPALCDWLASPKVSQEEQRDFISKYLLEDAHWLVERFLKLLVENRRLVYFPVVAEQFSALVDQHRRIASAKVTSAVPLSDEKAGQLKEALKRRFNLTDVRLTQTVDSSILGGLVVELLDQRIDSSLRTQLAQVHKALVPNRVSLPAS